MQRRLEPEILDTLPPGHPDALHNRRDLRLINQVMGNWRWFARTLPPLVRPGERVLELGAGTGELARALHPTVPRLDGLDRWPAPAGWPADASWHQTDVQDFTRWGDYPVVIGNLILHQFDATTLRALGDALSANARLIVLCEPFRHRRFQWIYAVCAPLFGANYVSRHDGRVSIAAGFCDDELPHALGFDPLLWRWHVVITGLGSYRLIAERLP